MTQHAREPWPSYAPTPGGQPPGQPLRQPAQARGPLSWASTARIGLAVFLGTLLALLVFGAAARIYIGYEAARIGEAISESFGDVGEGLGAGSAASTSAGGLSPECEGALIGLMGQTIDAAPDECQAETDSSPDELLARFAQLDITYTG